MLHFYHFPLVTHNVCLAFYLRTERQADGELDRALRDILVELSARKYLHSLMAVHVG